MGDRLCAGNPANATIAITFSSPSVRRKPTANRGADGTLATPESDFSRRGRKASEKSVWLPH